MHGKLLSAYLLHLRRRGLMPGSIERYRHTLALFLEWVDERTPDELATEELERYLDARGYTGRTRYAWVSTLDCFFEWAVEYGHLFANPAHRMVRPKIRPGLPRPITDTDLLLALEQAPADLGCWITLQAYAGLRIGEVAAMAYDWVLRTEDGWALAITGKGGKQRMVPLHPFAAQALVRHGIPRTGRVFRRPGGGPWSAGQASARLNRHMRACGIHATSHQLRHWFGTNVLRASGNLRATQELMGHSNPSTTAIYTQIIDGDKRHAVDGLPALGAQAAAPPTAGEAEAA